jgi:hypothetical protein
MGYASFFHRMKPGFLIRTADGRCIRFRYYTDEAPQTCAAFDRSLPFTLVFVHARVSGAEIWTEHAPHLDVPQENASVYTLPGEVVLGPSRPVRAKTRHAMGIYYGEGKGFDACNIFACVLEGDREALRALGDDIWRHGQQVLQFESI